jgi:hypothetical protein
VTKPLMVPCMHIADYYQYRWENHKCIAYNMLRHGYRQWATGYVRDYRVNNLYERPVKKRRPQTSVKQILVRDYNWRIGNLRRLYMNCMVLSANLQDVAQSAVQTQMSLETRWHEKRLEAISPENIDSAEAFLMMTEDPILANAIHEAQMNQREKERD